MQMVGLLCSLNGGMRLEPTYHTRAQCYKKFKAVIYERSYQASVFLPGKPFQPSLIFVGKV
jgi:hypothetical protein